MNWESILSEAGMAASMAVTILGATGVIPAPLAPIISGAIAAIQPDITGFQNAQGTPAKTLSVLGSLSGIITSVQTAGGVSSQALVWIGYADKELQAAMQGILTAQTTGLNLAELSPVA